MPECDTVLRGTLRYQGNVELVQAFADVGLLSLDETNYICDKNGQLDWFTFMTKLLNCESDMLAVTSAIKAKAKVSGSSIYIYICVCVCVCVL